MGGEINSRKNLGVMGAAAAVAYARVVAVSRSSSVQVEAQLQTCREIADQLGCHITRTYVDLGESGMNARRPELRQLLNELTEARPRYVIAANLSRFARRLDQFLAVSEKVRSAGAEIATRETMTATGATQAVRQLATHLGLEVADPEAARVGRKVGHYA